MWYQEQPHAGNHIVREIDGFSRDTKILSGGIYAAGTVVGEITDSGEFTQLNVEATDGSQIARAVLFRATNASQPVHALVNTGFTIVDPKQLTWPEGITEAQIIMALTELRQHHIRTV